MLEILGRRVENSIAVDVAADLVARFGQQGAHAAIDEVFDALSSVEGAALYYDWSLWGRPKQIPSGSWSTWGYLTGRGFGKTLGISRFINSEVEAGRSRIIGLAAQDEANCIALQIMGPSGLIATAPPWHRPLWEATAMQLVWPNGAKAIVRTPEVPGKIRGFDYDLAWLTELQSWPTATREESLMNFRIATRIGLARTIWDATPKRRHPLLRKLLAEHEIDPVRHVVVRGSTHENAINLAAGYIEERERELGGTIQGREELEGEMLSESESALVRQEWIDNARRPKPDAFKRSVLAIDPAITERKGSDTTGMIHAGLGIDDQVYVLRDDSGKMSPAAWAALALKRYVEGRIDLIVAETNKGGDLITQNLRAAASDRGLRVVVVGKDERPRHVGSVVYVKEVFARGAKEDRASPAATAYERGRVSHARGADLSALEDTITSWEPGGGMASPGDLDALAHAVNELLGLTSNKPVAANQMIGLDAIRAEIARPIKAPSI